MRGLRAYGFGGLMVCLQLAGGCRSTTAVKADTVREPQASEKKAVAAPSAPVPKSLVRATGTIQAVRAFTVQVPQIVAPIRARPTASRWCG